MAPCQRLESRGRCAVIPSPVTGGPTMSSCRFTIRAAGAALAVATIGTAMPPKHAAAHGFAGQRFFPATILTDDPFVADEVSLPTVNRPPTGLDRSQELDLDVDLAKRITPAPGFTSGQGWTHLKPKDMPGATGPSGLPTRLPYPVLVARTH